MPSKQFLLLRRTAGARRKPARPAAQRGGNSRFQRPERKIKYVSYYAYLLKKLALYRPILSEISEYIFMHQIG